MKSIVPCLWFDGRAEEALNFYLSVFPNSKLIEANRYGEGGPGGKGELMVARFTLNGQEFSILNGGSRQPFSQAVSMYVYCDDQPEVDAIWDRLSGDGGREQPCGWVVDRYGFSWQIVPVGFVEMVTDKDPVKAGRAMEAMMKMKKLDLSTLRRAFEGK